MQVGFGSGALWGTMLQDATGAAVANPTPIQFGVLQETTLDIEFTTKGLYGGNQFPVMIGRGQGKITGQAKAAQINGLAWANLMFGQAASSGLIGIYKDVTGVAIPATPYQVTVTPPSTGTFQEDLGVMDSNGNPMTAVAATPATGQYAVNTGTGQYTFAAADTGKTVFISYSYSATVTGAQKSTVINEPMGYSPTFSVDLSMNYKGSQYSIHLYQATSSKLSINTKLEDFLVPDFSFECYADSLNRVLTWSTNQ